MASVICIYIYNYRSSIAITIVAPFLTLTDDCKKFRKRVASKSGKLRQLRNSEKKQRTYTKIKQQR